MSRRRTRLLATLAVVVASLLAPAAAGPTLAPASAVSEGDDGVTVTVPTLGYLPHDDRFRVGPYSSRLHVLFNDTGLPAPQRLQLLDRHGRPTSLITVPRRGQLRVVAGYVVLDPVPGATGRLSFNYRAASPNGPAANGHAVVQLFRRVIVAANDKVTTRPNTPVTVDVLANDGLVVNGAVLACAPQLFAHPPRRPNPLPLVLPEPSRQPIDCVGRDRKQSLTTAGGKWRVDGGGGVTFSPSRGFTGTVRAYYRQASDYPFDLGVAGVSVSVGHRGTAVLGTKTGSHGEGRAGGPLAATGAVVVLLALAGGTLVLVGLLLVKVGRRRRQSIDLRA